MNDPFYSKYVCEDLILRDELAIDRTLLANERTLLAYLRSGVSLLIAGVSIIHFAQVYWFSVIGFACLPSGIITLVIGVFRFMRINKSLAHIRRISKKRVAKEKTRS
ncbi:DUF202 domain-containing protein [bacterium]|nr:DUF202 domain-containing protein [bacterium]